MNHLDLLAASYRRKAEQLRKLAELDGCEPTAELLLAVARTYDKSAEIADAIEQTYQALECDKKAERPPSESPSNEMRPAHNYQALAEEARKHTAEHAYNLQALLKVAESYDELTACAESIGRSRPPLN